MVSDPGIVSHFRGLVRNVESTGDPRLPVATTHVSDLDATDGEKFLARISGTQRTILHLAEGLNTDDAAHRHFLALDLSLNPRLHVPPDTWAITANLVAIHCTALHPEDFTTLASRGASMVWSPLSNYLLYGDTTDIKSALAALVRVAVGSDWAPSGSKNVLSELKIARVAASWAGVSLTAEQLVAMATVNPAMMLGWDKVLGSLEAQKLADLIVVNTSVGDPYEAIVTASEENVKFVMINGVPRVGSPALMQQLDITGETLTVGSTARILNTSEATADPTVEAITLATATGRLTEALAGLPNAKMPTQRSMAATLRSGRAPLAVEGIIDNHMQSRPHLRLDGELTGPNLRPASTRSAAAQMPLVALTLNPLTTVDDPDYYTRLAAARNIPDDMRKAIAVLQ